MVTHELVVDAVGPEGALSVKLRCGSEAPERSGGVQRRAAEAYRLVFETDEEPRVFVRAHALESPVAA